MACLHIYIYMFFKLCLKNPVCCLFKPFRLKHTVTSPASLARSDAQVCMLARVQRLEEQLAALDTTLVELADQGHHLREAQRTLKVQVERVEEEADLLGTQADRIRRDLREVISDLRREQSSGTSTGARPSVFQQPEQEPQASPTGIPPPATAKTEHPRGVVRKYYVVSHPARGQTAGIYTTYGAYADAVRDPTKHWNGRNKIPFQTGASGVSWDTRAQAEADWLGHFPGGGVIYCFPRQ